QAAGFGTIGEDQSSAHASGRNGQAPRTPPGTLTQFGGPDSRQRRLCLLLRCLRSLGYGHFGDGRLGGKALRLTDPIVLLDASNEGERLVEIGNVFVGKIGDLFEFDGAELIESSCQLLIDPLDPGEVIDFALRPLEALERRVEALGAGIGALEDARRFAPATAQVIEFGAAHLATAQHLDLGDVGPIDGKHAVDTLAVGNLAHRETFVNAAARAGDYDTLVGL